jgi:hypothetical protein
LPHPLDPARGTPALQFFTMRIMNWLRIPYGASHGLKRAVMETITNPRTVAQVTWFRNTHFPGTAWDRIPPDELSRFLQSTHSGQYGAETLAFAGYRVTGARLVPKPKSTPETMGVFRRAYEEVAEGGESFDAFIGRHNLAPDSPVEGGFDIVLDAAPW